MTAFDDLHQQMAKRQVIAIVGAGVSMGATGGAETASWVGLLRDGIKRCEHFGAPPKGWGDRQREALEHGDLDDLLGVASQIENRLDAPDGGEYSAWLQDTVGRLRVRDREVLEALRDLGIPLATTNYDDLIEEVTTLPAVTWRDGAAVQRVIRGDESGVLHLHGYWRQPESVVLGIRSYDAVLGDTHAQTVQSALALMNSFLFIGYGAGLADPNFGALLRWMRRVFAGSEYRHYRLWALRRNERSSRSLILGRNGFLRLRTVQPTWT
jgi:SIR2-like domain